jgi:hypothetical protein
VVLQQLNSQYYRPLLPPYHQPATATQHILADAIVGLKTLSDRVVILDIRLNEPGPPKCITEPGRATSSRNKSDLNNLPLSRANSIGPPRRDRESSTNRRGSTQARGLPDARTKSEANSSCRTDASRRTDCCSSTNSLSRRCANTRSRADCREEASANGIRRANSGTSASNGHEHLASA